MRTSALKYAILSWVSWLTMLIILLVPFHAFLTIWAASLIDHYTAVRLWKEVLLVFCGLGALFLVVTDHKIRSHTLSRRLVWLILGYIAVNLVWGAVAFNNNDVTAKALGYGLISNLRFLVFFLIAWAVSLRMARLRVNWQWVSLWPAGVVVIFGLLQIFVLPHDFLRHFGYGPGTIDPFETINSNQHYIRAMSTLRGANPLGAYLIVPISMLVVLLVRPKSNWRQWLLLSGCLIVLFFSFSRSAWIGAALSIAVILFISLKSRRAQKIILLSGAALLLLAGGLTAALHNNDRFENLVFHTQDESAVKTTSNQGHLSGLKEGAKTIAHYPLGSGPGTAGPASVYNNQPRIAENYFIQIGQETGVIGLTLFILINIGVGYLLWLRRADTLAFSLFASLIGLTFVNLLSHAWADDTLAYVWWGLAGIAMASPALLPGETKHGKH